MFFTISKMKELTIATDFSGINAPLHALDKMNIKYKLIFSCDNDIHCKKQILAHHAPICFFDDIKDTKTRLNHFPPEGYIDIYVSSMPCQPYSGLTNRSTLEEKNSKIQGNTELLKHVLFTIRKLRPKVAIFENVALFKREPDYDTLIKSMKRYKYDVYSEILNSKDYGIPQLRRRVYIICILKSIPKKCESFQYPPPKVDKCRSVISIANSKSDNVTSPVELTEAYRLFLSQNKHKIKQHAFVNLCSATRHNTFPADMKNIGCLTTNCCGMYNLIKNRYATIDELLMLQGFDPKKFTQVVTNRQLTKQIGNSMTVNVLEAIFKSIFDYILLK